MGPIHARGHAGAPGERRALGLAAHRLPAPRDLAPGIPVEVAGEAEDEAHHVIGDHVREEPPHVGEDGRVGDQLREEIVLEARRG